MDLFESRIRELLLRTGSEPLLIVSELPVRQHIESVYRLLQKRPNSSRIISISFDEYTDFRDLIGQWICWGNSKKPIKWLPGVMAKAIREGWWLILEDAGRCNLDVLSVVDEIRLSGRLLNYDKSPIKVHPNFRIIGLIRECNNASLIEPSHESQDSDLAQELLKIPDETVRRPTWKYLRHWQRIRVPLSFVREKIEQAILSASTETHAFFTWMVNVMYPNFMMRIKETPPYNSIAAVAYRRLPSSQALLDCIQMIDSRKHCFPSLDRWNDINNVPRKERQSLAAVIASVFMSPLPRFVRQLILPIFSEHFKLAPELLTDLVHPRIPGGIIDINDNNLFGLSATQVHTSVFLQAMEAITRKQPVLLVGGAGTGKSDMCASLARAWSKLNGQRERLNRIEFFSFHNQTEASDLIGGFVPSSTCDQLRKLFRQIMKLFQDCSFANADQMEIYCGLANELEVPETRQVVQASLVRCCQFLTDKVQESPSANVSKLEKRALLYSRKWEDLMQSPNNMTMTTFQHGPMLKCLIKGYWLVLDEINLASPDILARLSTALSRDTEEFLVHDNKSEVLKIHPNFRILATMNPPHSVTDTGEVISAPSTSKIDLPDFVRNKFFEIYVDDLNTIEDVLKIIDRHPACLGIRTEIAKTYLTLRNLSVKGELLHHELTTSCVNLRSLTRTIVYAEQRGLVSNERSYQGFIIDGFLTFFMSNMTGESKRLIEGVVANTFNVRLSKTKQYELVDLKRPLRQLIDELKPSCKIQGRDKVIVEDFILPFGNTTEQNLDIQQRFICTPSVRDNLINLVRLMSGCSAPILLEGPTSAGKTSLVEYLCSLTGHKFVRINNHDQICMSEYTGQYVADLNGAFSFEEGPLVKAMRNGDWVVLDEFNLAPTEVSEGLNRLLDDNRELRIPEIDLTVQPHPDFRLFATQNPATYGGRKVLSEALRSRFVNMYIDEPPIDELALIVMVRCGLPRSLAQIMTQVFEELRIRRVETRQTFEVLMTIRDLLRWGNMSPTDLESLYITGFRVIGERLRTEEAREGLRNILVTHIFQAKKIVPALSVVEEYDGSSKFKPLTEFHLTMTKHTKRLLTLLQNCWESDDSCILIGATGTGKTAAVQYISQINSQWKFGDPHAKPLIVVNCQQNTEVSDLIGFFKPTVIKREDIENISAKMTEVLDQCQSHIDTVENSHDCSDQNINKITEGPPHIIDLVIGKLQEANKMIHESLESENATLGWNSNHFVKLRPIFESIESLIKTHDIVFQPLVKRRRMNDEINENKSLNTALFSLIKEVKSLQKLFKWKNGPLTDAVVKGLPILLDEINLADEAVVERMNSLLETPRSLFIPELGENEGQDGRIEVHPDFRFFATMNPGGDFGKKELSRAMRNRLFEIFVPEVAFEDDSCRDLITDRFNHCQLTSSMNPQLITRLISAVVNTIKWMESISVNRISLRELFTWVDTFIGMIESTALPPNPLNCITLLMHAFCASITDGYTLGNRLKTEVHTASMTDDGYCQMVLEGFIKDESDTPASYILYRTIQILQAHFSDYEPRLLTSDWWTTLIRNFWPTGMGWLTHTSGDHSPVTYASNGAMSVGPFTLQAASVSTDDSVKNSLTLDCTATAMNLGRLVRAVNCHTSVLIEGPPGVGKTAVVEYLAGCVGRRLYRLNLSEQTELSDLTGSFVPEESSFSWRHGPLVEAVKNGDWILLDEINLAPQPVLEGLNSLLDHRRELFIPEADECIVLSKNSTFRLFAAQNSFLGGGGRKGLPRSFLNRFIKIEVKELDDADQMQVALHYFSDFCPSSLNLTVKTFSALSKVAYRHPSAHLWSWNIRDLQKVRRLYTTINVNQHLNQGAEEELLMVCLWLVFGAKLFHAEDILTVKQVIEDVFCRERFLDDVIRFGCHRWVLNRMNNSIKPVSEKSFDWVTTVLQAELSLACEARIPIILSTSDLSEAIVNLTCLAEGRQQLLEPFYMHPSIDSSALLGSYSRSSSDLGKEMFSWSDSVVVNAVTEGRMLVIFRTESAQAGVLDRLNSILEEQRCLTVTESGLFRRIKVHPNLRIVFVSCDLQDTGLSSAIRNRCIELRCRRPMSVNQLPSPSLPLQVNNKELLVAKDTLTGEKIEDIQYLIDHMLQSVEQILSAVKICITEQSKAIFKSVYIPFYLSIKFNTKVLKNISFYETLRATLLMARFALRDCSQYSEQELLWFAIDSRENIDLVLNKFRLKRWLKLSDKLSKASTNNDGVISSQVFPSGFDILLSHSFDLEWLPFKSVVDIVCHIWRDGVTETFIRHFAKLTSDLNHPKAISVLTPRSFAMKLLSNTRTNKAQDAGLMLRILENQCLREQTFVADTLKKAEGTRDEMDIRVLMRRAMKTAVDPNHGELNPVLSYRLCHWAHFQGKCDGNETITLGHILMWIGWKNGTKLNLTPPRVEQISRNLSLLSLDWILVKELQFSEDHGATTFSSDDRTTQLADLQAQILDFTFGECKLTKNHPLYAAIQCSQNSQDTQLAKHLDLNWDHVLDHWIQSCLNIIRPDLFRLIDLMQVDAHKRSLLHMLDVTGNNKCLYQSVQGTAACIEVSLNSHADPAGAVYQVCEVVTKLWCLALTSQANNSLMNPLDKKELLSAPTDSTARTYPDDLVTALCQSPVILKLFSHFERQILDKKCNTMRPQVHQPLESMIDFLASLRLSIAKRDVQMELQNSFLEEIIRSDENQLENHTAVDLMDKLDYFATMREEEREEMEGYSTTHNKDSWNSVHNYMSALYADAVLAFLEKLLELDLRLESTMQALMDGVKLMAMILNHSRQSSLGTSAFESKSNNVPIAVWIILSVCRNLRGVVWCLEDNQIDRGTSLFAELSADCLQFLNRNYCERLSPPDRQRILSQLRYEAYKVCQRALTIQNWDKETSVIPSSLNGSLNAEPETRGESIEQLLQEQGHSADEVSIQNISFREALHPLKTKIPHNGIGNLSMRLWSEADRILATVCYLIQSVKEHRMKELYDWKMQLGNQFLEVYWCFSRNGSVPEVVSLPVRYNGEFYSALRPKLTAQETPISLALQVDDKDTQKANSLITLNELCESFMADIKDHSLMLTEQVVNYSEKVSYLNFPVQKHKIMLMTFRNIMGNYFEVAEKLQKVGLYHNMRNRKTPKKIDFSVHVDQCLLGSDRQHLLDLLVVIRANAIPFNQLDSPLRWQKWERINDAHTLEDLSDIINCTVNNDEPDQVSSLNGVSWTIPQTTNMNWDDDNGRQEEIERLEEMANHLFPSAEGLYEEITSEDTTTLSAGNHSQNGSSQRFSHSLASLADWLAQMCRACVVDSSHRSMRKYLQAFAMEYVKNRASDAAHATEILSRLFLHNACDEESVGNHSRAIQPEAHEYSRYFEIEDDFYHTPGMEYIANLRPSLMVIHEKITAINHDYEESSIQCLMELQRHVKRALKLPVLKTTKSVLAFVLDPIWDSLSQWQKKFTRRMDSFDREQETIRDWIIKLRQEEADGWSSLIARRFSQSSRKFWEHVGLKVVGALFSINDENCLTCLIELAYNIDGVFRDSSVPFKATEAKLLQLLLKVFGSLFSGTVNGGSKSNMSLTTYHRIGTFLFSMAEWIDPHVKTVELYLKQKLAPLETELKQVQRLLKLETKDIDSRRKHMDTKRLQVARTILKADAVLNTTCFVIMKEHENVQLEGEGNRAKNLLEKIGINIVDQREEPVNSSSEYISQIEICKGLIEDLLEKQSRNTLARNLVSLRESLKIFLSNLQEVREKPEVHTLVLEELIMPDTGYDTLNADPANPERPLTSKIRWSLLRNLEEFVRMNEASYNEHFLKLYSEWMPVVYTVDSHALNLYHASTKLMQFCAVWSLTISEVSQKQTTSYLIRRDWLDQILSDLTALRVFVQAGLAVTFPTMKSYLSESPTMPHNANMTDLFNSLFRSLESVSRSLEQQIARYNGIDYVIMSQEDILRIEDELTLQLDTTQLEALDLEFDDSFASNIMLRFQNISSALSIRGEVPTITIDNLSSPPKFESDTLESASLNIFQQSLVSLQEFQQSVKVQLTNNPISKIHCEIADPELVKMKFHDIQTVIDERLNVTLQLGMVLTVVFKHIAKNGFNLEQKPEEQEQEGEQTRFKDDWITGQGLADGSGVAEAQESIEFEHEMDTLEENKTDEPTVEENKPTEGITTDLDFAAKTENLNNNDDSGQDESDNDNPEEDWDSVDNGGEGSAHSGDEHEDENLDSTSDQKFDHLNGDPERRSPNEGSLGENSDSTEFDSTDGRDESGEIPEDARKDKPRKNEASNEEIDHTDDNEVIDIDANTSDLDVEEHETNEDNANIDDEEQKDTPEATAPENLANPPSDDLDAGKDEKTNLDKADTDLEDQDGDEDLQGNDDLQGEGADEIDDSESQSKKKDGENVENTEFEEKNQLGGENGDEEKTDNQARSGVPRSKQQLSPSSGRKDGSNVEQCPYPQEEESNDGIGEGEVPNNSGTEQLAEQSSDAQQNSAEVPWSTTSSTQNPFSLQSVEEAKRFVRKLLHQEAEEAVDVNAADVPPDANSNGEDIPQGILDSSSPAVNALAETDHNSATTDSAKDVSWDSSQSKKIDDESDAMADSSDHHQDIVKVANTRDLQSADGNDDGHETIEEENKAVEALNQTELDSEHREHAGSAETGPTGVVSRDSDKQLELDDDNEAQTKEIVISWRAVEERINVMCMDLCESLRTVLEPTNRGKYEGYYKTGRKLSMKQVMAFIASDFQKDKIWLRRNKLSKRNYQIMLAIDNSASMRELGAHEPAILSMMAIALALRRLETGDMSIFSFGSATVRQILPFGSPLDAPTGQNILDALTFDLAERGGFDRAMPWLIDGICNILEAGQSDCGSKQLLLILTDGRFSKKPVRQKLQRLVSLGITPVLLIVDAERSSEGSSRHRSIFDVKEPVWITNKLDPSRLHSKFLNPIDFPFRFYTVVQKIQDLPRTIADVIRNWISAETSQNSQ